MSELKDLIPIIQSLSGDAKTAFIIYLVVQVIEYCIVLGSLAGAVIYGISRWYKVVVSEQKSERYYGRIQTVRHICYEERSHPSSHSELIGKIQGALTE